MLLTMFSTCVYMYTCYITFTIMVKEALHNCKQNECAYTVGNHLSMSHILLILQYHYQKKHLMLCVHGNMEYTLTCT